MGYVVHSCVRNPLCPPILRFLFSLLLLIPLPAKTFLQHVLNVFTSPFFKNAVWIQACGMPSSVARTVEAMVRPSCSRCSSTPLSYTPCSFLALVFSSSFQLLARPVLLRRFHGDGAWHPSKNSTARASCGRKTHLLNRLPPTMA